MKPEVVAESLAFPEGPVVLADGRVAFCEECGSRVSVFDGREVSIIAQTGGSPNGATLGADGALYVAQNGGVVGSWRAKPMISPSVQRIERSGAVKELLKTTAHGPLLAPNDICFGSDQRLYFTDSGHPFDPNNRTHPGAIYAVSGDGVAEQVMDLGPVYPNGLGFQCDGRLLWVETYERHVCALENGRRKVLCQLPEGHLPDGLAVTTTGEILIASFTSHGISIVSSQGDYLGLIELDSSSHPTNCAFQDETLWVTDVGDYSIDFFQGRLWRVPTKFKGFPLPQGSIPG